MKYIYSHIQVINELEEEKEIEKTLKSVTKAIIFGYGITIGYLLYIVWKVHAWQFIDLGNQVIQTLAETIGLV